MLLNIYRRNLVNGHPFIIYEKEKHGEKLFLVLKDKIPHGVFRRDVPDLFDFPEQFLCHVDYFLLRDLFDSYSLALIYPNSGKNRRRRQRFTTNLRTATYPLF